jgi:pimeloyl-ACP methyl ester carboxylesterase
MVDHLAEETIKLETATGTIVGTLALPAGQGPFTVALVIAGSGPTDRNGNSPLLAAPNNSLKYLAEGLTAKGIATVRYDKRGVGESVSAARSEAELRFDHYVDDAADWVRLLRKDRRFGRAAIVGHSEGALIGMLAAEASRADAMVSIAGAGRPAHQALRDQIGPRLPPDLMKESDRIIDLILAGKTTDSVPAALMALYRPSVQPYLVSYFKQDPARIIGRLTMPVLIAQGTTDIQIAESEARLLAKAQPTAKLLIIEGMNHLLKRVSGDLAAQTPSYSDPKLPVVPEVIDGIAGFLLDLR